MSALQNDLQQAAGAQCSDQTLKVRLLEGPSGTGVCKMTPELEGPTLLSRHVFVLFHHPPFVTFKCIKTPSTVNNFNPPS